MLQYSYNHRCYNITITYSSFPGDGVYREVRRGTVSVADILCTTNNQLLKKIPVLEVTVKCTPLYIAVKSRPFGGSFAIIPNLLQVSQLSVTMVLPQTLKPSIVFSGTVTIAGQSINVQITYTFSKDGEFEVLADTRLPSLKLKEVVQRLTSLSIPLPSSVGFLDKAVLKMKGTFTKNLDGDMIIEVQLKSGNRIFAVLQRENGKTKTAIAADIAKIRLSHFIRSVTKQDISSVPFLGTLMLPELGVTVSKQTIVSELASEKFKNTRLLKYFAENIPSGVTAFIRIESMRVIMKVTYDSEQMSLKVKEGVLSVRTFLKQIRVNVGRIPLPAGFTHIWDIQVAEIGYNFKDRVIFMTFELKKTLKYFGGLIQVMNPTVRLEIKQPKREVTMEANGYVIIAGTKFSVLITKGDDGKYYLDASAKKISFGPLLTSFRTSILPPQLKSLTRSLPFLNFGVKDFRIVLPFDKQRPRVYLSGKPVIAGYSPLKISAVIIRLQPNNVVTVLEIDLGRPNLARLLGQLAPRAAGTLRNIAILNQNIRTQIIISPKGVRGVKLSNEIARVFNVHQGITVRAELKIPSNCGKDIFCKVAQLLLPKNTKLNIEASIVSTTHFRLLAGISGNIKIPGGLTLKQAGLEIKVAGGVTNIGIVGKIALRNPRLDLTARISQSVSGVTLEMIAAGCWNNAFGLPILDICNIHAAVGFGPGTAITEIAFGAKINFGHKRCRPLTAIGYVGINSVNPNQNYYYVKYPKGMSLSVLLRAMCINTRIIPAPIANSGLMPGFLYSFSATGKSIPEIRLHIPAGLQLNGRINILGYIVSANIKVTPSRGIYVAISMPPLNVARGLLKIYRSPSDRSHGPFLKADLRPPTIKVQACGYISVLGISVSSCLKITRNQLMFTIHGRILHIMRASLTIYTQSGGSLITRNFQAKGTINPGEFHRLVNPVKNAVSRIANVAGNAIRKATNFISNRLNVFNGANSALNRARNALGRLQGRFNGAVNRVNSLRHRVNSICHIRRCGSSKFILCLINYYVREVIKC